MQSQIRYFIKYLKYYLFSKHKKGHGIHSPFLFNLIQNVFNKNIIDTNLQKVFKLHDQYKKSKELIEFNEIGAGSSYKTTKKQTIGLIVKRSSINKKYGKLIYDLVQYFDCKDILELGTSVGISTLYIAQAAKKSKFTTIEGVSEKIEIARKITGGCNHKQINFVCEDFDKILSSVLHKFDKFDFVFFDGNHTKQSTINYFKICLDKIHNETVFVFDDIHWSKEMEEAWNYIKKHEKVRLSVDLFRMGLIFFKKELSYEHYVIKF